MPKTDTDFEASSQAPARDVSDDITLDEYCLRRSIPDRRPELINGFHSAEKLAGVVKDSQAAFDARFQAFVNKPC